MSDHQALTERMGALAAAQAEVEALYARWAELEAKVKATRVGRRALPGDGHLHLGGAPSITTAARSAPAISQARWT